MHIATLMLLGSGELGKEFAIAAKRLGCRVIACDRYVNAPAMQVADACEVFPMLDGAALRAAVEKHRPDHIVPEIEAIDTAALGVLKSEGWHVVPSARAVQLTMNRDGIRDWATAHVTGFHHLSSTCREGVVTDPLGRVLGYENLFICDASLFPKAPPRSPFMPIVQMAERLSAV